MNMKMKKYILTVALLSIMTSCDTDIIPRGQSVLDTTEELEYLFNSLKISEKPATNLGVVVNEDYDVLAGVRTVKTQISNENTLAAAYLTYNESTDRNALNTTDSRYVSLYKNINSFNIIIAKADGSKGDANLKTRIKAEAHLMRAYMYYLVAGIYAAQYTPETASGTGGIVYTTSYDATPQPQLKLDKVWENILADCNDEYINALPDDAPYNRCTKATGNAIKAKVLFQMKRYDEALTYAREALRFNSTIEDRRTIEETIRWNLTYDSPNNLIYIPETYPYRAGLVYEKLTLETAELFEPGDMVRYYGYNATKPTPGKELWSEDGYYYSGVRGCLIFQSGTVYDNTWGITVERTMYLAAECLIRTGHIEEGMDIINTIRENRIHASIFQPLEASSENEAMAILQRAKFIENLGTYENFFDRKRWNTEDKYKRVITRTIPDLGQWSIQPDSKLWIMPMPVQVFQNNPGVTSNI